MRAVIGEVVRIGANVKHLEVGQRVGVGAQAGSCLECDACKAGLQQHCSGSTGMIGSYQGKWEDGSVSQGGYADFTRVKGQLAVPIPENLESEPTAPLLCAGVTVYAPLKRHGCGPGKKVGIVGVRPLLPSLLSPEALADLPSVLLVADRRSRPPCPPDRLRHGRRDVRALALDVQGRGR